MMKRFSRRRRNSGGEGAKSSIDAAEWMPKLLEKGVVEAAKLEPWTDPAIPSSVAAIGRGERADGTSLIVAFSPKSATEALLAGISAAQFAVEADSFAGQLLVIAPQWESGPRRVLSLLGRTPYSIEPVAAPSLATGRVNVSAETSPLALATNATQLAARLPEAESRAAFQRAATGLEGLSAKHGGAMRVGLDRLELVVLARRVAEIRVSESGAVLETQIGGRASTPLSGADLASALDGLEGQIRRRLNDRKVREGEEGLRGRVIAQLASGTELRGLNPWPMPGADLAVIDGVGLNAEGNPVVVAVREELEWTSLANVLEAIGPIESLLPVLFANDAPPIRLGSPRLLLAAERFAEGVERAMAAFTIAYELRKVSGSAGAAVDLVSSGSGDGAQARAPRRGRRRGGRGRTNGREDSKNTEDLAEESTDSETATDAPREPRRRPRRGSEETPAAAASSREDESSDESEAGRGRTRRPRRSRRGRGGNSEAGETAGRDSAEEGRSGEASGHKRPRFEELSLMDLDDASSSSNRNDSGAGSGSDDDSPSGSERARRSSRRGRRGGSRRGGSENAEKSGDSSTSKASSDDDAGPDAVLEEDLVDADDLSEILARLPDDTPEFDSSDESYEDAEEIDEDDVQSARRRDRDSRRRSKKAAEEEIRPTSRGRAAVLVHADADSLIAGVLLARDIRQLEGMWVYPQDELMTFFKGVATDLRDDTSIFVIGFSPSPARDVIQAAALYRGRLDWFGRQAWPPEDLVALRESLGKDAVHGGDGIDSTLPLVLETCTRRSRFSDKLVDLSAGRFTQHDFERWGRLWRWRIGEIAKKSGEIRSEIGSLLAGRPSDLAKEAALIDIPPIPAEVTWVSENDFRLVHFGGHVMVIMDVEGGFDLPFCARVGRERYGATLSLAHRVGEDTFILAGDETSGKRALDYLAVSEHLVNKLEWVEPLSDGDHIARFRIRELERYPERLEEVIGEIAMSRSLLER